MISLDMGVAPLHQIVVVGIDAGNERLPELIAQTVGEDVFLAFAQVGAGGKHDLEGEGVGLKLVEHRAPEEDIVVALDIGHHPPARFVGPQAVGCLDVPRRDVVCQSPCHVTSQ